MFQFCLKSDNNGYFTWRPMYISACRNDWGIHRLTLFTVVTIFTWGIPSQLCNYMSESSVMTSSARQTIDIWYHWCHSQSSKVKFWWTWLCSSTTEILKWFDQNNFSCKNFKVQNYMLCMWLKLYYSCFF